MKYDVQFFYLIIGIGLISPKLTWRGWFGVGMLIAAWMFYTVMKG